MHDTHGISGGVIVEEVRRRVFVSAGEARVRMTGECDTVCGRG